MTELNERETALAWARNQQGKPYVWPDRDGPDVEAFLRTMEGYMRLPAWKRWAMTHSWWWRLPRLIRRIGNRKRRKAA